MTNRDYIQIATDYAHDVVSGKIPASYLTVLSCKRQLRDLDRQDTDEFPYIFNPWMVDGSGKEYQPGVRICAFAEKLTHVKGAWKEQTIHLEPWQVFALTTLFGWVHRETGLRRFREVYWEIARKNGKSVLGAIIGLYMFAADGEGGAEVYSGATSEKQAWEVFRPARLMTIANAPFRKAYSIEYHAKDLTTSTDYSRFEPLIGNPGDGASPHCAIVDEYHEHKTPEQYDTMATGQGARSQPLLAVITTAGSNIAGPCHEKRSQVVKILEEVFENEEIFGLIFTIDKHEHNIIVQSYYELERLEELCDCDNIVSTTQIEKLWLEECVKLVMTGGMLKEGKKEQINANTLIGQLRHLDCAEAVTKRISKKEIQNIEKDKIRTLKNGQKTTETEQRKQVKNGESKINKKFLKKEDLLSSELHGKNLKKCQKNKTEYAQFVLKNQKLYAWIIATVQILLEDYCVDFATLQLGYLAILQKVWNEHLDTCNIRKITKIVPEGLQERRPPDDWTDLENWKKANPNYGVSVYEDYLKSRLLDALQNPAKQNIVRCKHLNQWMNVAEAFFDMVAVDKCADPDLNIEDFHGEKCWPGIDIASKVDLASKVKIFKREIDGDDHYYAFADFYLPLAATKGEDKSHYQGWMKEGWLTVTHGNRLDVDRIEEDLEQDAREFELVEVPHDPWNAAQFAAHMLDKDIPMVEIQQTVRNLSEPTKELDALIRDGKFHHDGNPLLVWCLANVVCEYDTNDNVKPKRAKGQDHQKIDGAISAIMGLSRAMVYKEKSKGNDGSLI